MLGFLFRGLTDRPKRGQQLFDTAVAEARCRHWYVEGGVPDTLDGRFAMLATICALATVRLENGSEAAALQSPALTERFVEAMDAEHRQMGISDPAIGKTVRKMVGSLARRVGEWRSATAGETDWSAATASSVYPSADVAAGQLEHSSAHLRRVWERLCEATDQDLVEGKF